ncbi:uroporphyrinogen-III C-methyltransferase [Glaciecola petra]|uniref:uroporphyrinogen-III C-methyltransferase n=1 Tax=Glaciecola petra TaxID=3075602 RepID=A0ABU2ZSU3_9ALTE|nr:uroporphyrinogen-III C-methyltransferase [Aestuariibacter sp. P117]MDT0595709.1 uroporphyrinogen-III C-methyltransferase [Aestuariibacter sp. P117]
MTLAQTFKTPFNKVSEFCKDSLPIFNGPFSLFFKNSNHNNKNSDSSGRVTIVGAGPGDPDLLTIKALKALQKADIVLFDWLVSPAILQLIPKHTAKEFVGKRCGKHSMPQTSISELVLMHAQNGKNVVRLKGGDPAIFARTLEEAKVLAMHNIPFSIVPGITAASGASAYTGLTLTHRACAQSVRYITASLQRPADEPNWKSIVASAETETLVFYMGLSKLGLICERLQTAGLTAGFPICVIDNACTDEQKMVVSNLGDIEKNEAIAALTGPAIIVVGRVIEHYHPVSTRPIDLHQTSDIVATIR